MRYPAGRLKDVKGRKISEHRKSRFASLSINSKIIVCFATLILLFNLLQYFIQVGEAEKIRYSIIPGINDIVSSYSIEKTSYEIRFYDEILTQSARNYAFTGDTKWKQRYLDYEPLLDQSIKSAIANGGEDDKRIFSEIDAANIALVGMEHAAIGYVDSNSSGVAIGILDGKEYLSEKKVYSDGLGEYYDRTSRVINQNVSSSISGINKTVEDVDSLSTKVSQVSILFLVASVLASVALSFFMSRYITKPLKDLREIVVEIGNGKMKSQKWIESDDEIGQLARTFREMTKKIEKARREMTDYNSKLERIVDSRTKSLQDNIKQNEKFNEFATERELKMIELKKKIKELEDK